MTLTRARAPLLLIVVTIFGLSLLGCTTPYAVSRFCASATTTLTSAQPVFDDMRQSCLREVNSRAAFGAFTPPLQSDANCTAIGDQVVGAEAAAKVLSDYFTAINSLASFGTAKAGTDAQTLITKTGAAVGASSAAQTALGSMAQLLVSAATSGYQEKQLEKDLPKVSRNITDVTAALVTIVQVDYGRLLNQEENKLTTQYRELAMSKSPEFVLALETRWQADELTLQSKRASAKSLVAALQVLSRGFSDLATNAHQLTAQEVPSLLEPYITQIQALVPQIQKAF